MKIQLSYRPFQNQLRAHRATQKHILYGGAVGGGKSVWLVNDALQQCLAWPGNRVAIFRWEYATFRKTTYKTMKEWVLDIPGLVVGHNQADHSIMLCNGSEIDYGGIKPSSAVSGDIFSVIKSLEVNAIYIDELTDVPADVFAFICTRVPRVRCANYRTGVRGFPLPRVAGSCNPHLGWIKHRFVDQQLQDDIFVRSRVRDNFHVSSRYEADLWRAWRNSPDMIDRYLEGDWNATVDFSCVCLPHLLAAARRRRLEPGEPVEFGIDIGAGGGGKTVIVMRQGFKSEIILEDRLEADTMKTVNKIVMLAERYGPERIKIDAVGLGKGPYDRLAEMGLPVEAMVGGASPDDERFLNQRTEQYWQLRLLLEEGRIELPDSDETINELGSIKYLIGNERKIQVEGKKLIIKRLGHSPDYADAVVYAFAGAGDPSVMSALIRVG